MEILRRSEEELWKEMEGRGGWEGIRFWLRWLKERLPARVQADLRGWLEAEGLVNPNQVVLMSTSGLRRWGMQQLGIEPVVFNGNDIRRLLREVPEVADLLAGSVGAGNLTELIKRGFGEVNWLALKMPHEPYRDHVLVRTGVVDEGLHPLSMARWKVFGLDLFLYLAGVKNDLKPWIVGIDTVNALRMNMEEAVYYGIPPEVVEQLGDDWWFLDKSEGIKDDLAGKGGLMESWWDRIIEIMESLGQLRVGVESRRLPDRKFGVLNGIFLEGDGQAKGLWWQMFAAMKGYEVPRDPKIPGSLDIRILPDEVAPFKHHGGEGWLRLNNGAMVGWVYPALDGVQDTFEKQMEELALVMMGVRGFPADPVAVMLGVDEDQWQRYITAIVGHPERWMNHVI